jgi:hypothetical protein
MTLLKNLTIRMLIVCGLFLNTSMAVAEVAKEISKDEFLETYISTLRQSSDIQKQAESQSRAAMLENLGEERYKQYEADLKEMEKTRKEGMAKCMGISTQEIDLFTKEMDAEFQIKSVQECSSALPAKISSAAFSGSADSQQLEEFAACLEGIASKKTGIPLAKLKQCAQ